MLEIILGNRIKERALLFLLTRKEGYAREIAAAFGGQLTSYLNQLRNMERAGVLVSKLKGKTRVYVLNPRYPFKAELEKLLNKALSFMPQKEKEKYYMPRLRPRRAGKPL
jgi:predicted transcriptional regulator